MDLSTTSFRAVVVPHVPPIHLTGKRLAWLREDLDAWLDKQAGRSSVQPAEETVWPVL